MSNIMNNNYKLIGAMANIEDLKFNHNKETNLNCYFTTYIGTVNHYFIWTYEDSYTLWYCNFLAEFDKDDYTQYEDLTLEEVINIVKESNF